MSKATEVTTALKNAYSEVNELVNVLTIIMSNGRIEVLVESLRDLKQIPSHLLIESTANRENGFVAEAWKQYKGVRFNTFLRKEELEEVSA